MTAATMASSEGSRSPSWTPEPRATREAHDPAFGGVGGGRREGGQGGHEQAVAGGAPKFRLMPARPNPFGSETDIAFEIPAAASVRVSIHDVTGKSVRSLTDGAETFSGGRHSLH